MDEADSLCDTICIMDHGSVVANGTALELKRQVAGDIIEFGMNSSCFEKAKALLKNHTDIKEIRITDNSLKLYVEAGEKALPEILPVFVEAKISISTIEMSRPSLEEVFLKNTGHSLKNNTETGMMK
jgi:ABC-2 type transport system ATP-binding protein